MQYFKTLTVAHRTNIWSKPILISIFGMLSLAYNPTQASATKGLVGGIQFKCNTDDLSQVQSNMASYLEEMNIASRYVTEAYDREHSTLTYTLSTPIDDVVTLDLFDRPEFQLKEVLVEVPSSNGSTRKIKTVSPKEIVLALLQHGRLTEFKDSACNIKALSEHIGVRQNIVAFAEINNFGWPEGGPAKWNEKYWYRGTPKPNVTLQQAMSDIFLDQSKYEIGCYTATKIVVTQGIIDYYKRVNPDALKLKLIEQRLSADNDPLVDIEPGRVWDFESDYDTKEYNRPGKVVGVQYNIASKNFVPGDWVYMLNTDTTTYKITGYEGSNAIYLGRGKFDDYYNDNEHSYSYRHKIHEVYQWRNNVFSAQRDGANVKPLTSQDIERLGHTPAEGGIVLDLRIAPYFFGYENLPDMPQSTN
jgi:hypothetical protein